jgi:hypothetical protein
MYGLLGERIAKLESGVGAGRTYQHRRGKIGRCVADVASG